MRILGIDYGDRSVGLAISDPLHLTAQPLMSYRLQGEKRDREFFRDLAARYEIQKVVLGVPFRMDGQEGRRVEKTREFGQWLKKILRLPVDYWDERLTTQQAQSVMKNQKIPPPNKKSVEDQISASLILAAYLESLPSREDSRAR